MYTALFSSFSFSGYSPYEAHFNSHSASEIARYNDGMLIQQQRQALRVFSTAPDRQFNVGDMVMVKNRRHAFHKNDPINYPTYETDLYKVISICKKLLPWKFLVERQTDSKKTKQLYAFEIRKANQTDSSSEPIILNPTQIKVNDVIHRNNSTLRSGKIIPKKDIIYYRIEIDGKEDIIPQESLRLMKRTFTNASFTYSPFFVQGNNNQYII
jgi:hypothetical protein